MNCAKQILTNENLFFIRRGLKEAMPFKAAEMFRDVIVDRHEQRTLLDGFMLVGIGVVEIFDDSAAARKVALLRPDFSRRIGEVNVFPLHHLWHRSSVALELLK